MKKSRYFLLIALLTASQAAAQTIPSTQNRPDSRVHLSDPCTHLADPRTHLSDPRTHLSDPRTHLSDPRTHLSEPRTHLSDPRTHLSDPRTHLSDPRTLDISDLYDDRFFLGGLDDKILSSTVHDGTLYVSGDFTWLDGITLLNRIAMWDGTTLQPVGDGFNGSVRVLASIQGSLYAGGDFTHSGGQEINRIARLDAASGTWQPVHEGFNQSVHALAEFHQKPIAAGAFTESGSRQVPYVAWLDSTEGWQPVGEDISRTVLALLAHGDTLIAGGAYLGRNEDLLHFHARWQGDPSRTDGSWTTMGQELTAPVTTGIGPGLQTSVYALAVHADKPVSGGNFWMEQTLDYYYQESVARWDGNQWQPLGYGLQYTGDYNRPYLKTLKSFGGDLYAGGTFVRSYKREVLRIARWMESDTMWVTVGDGLDAPVHTLSAHDGALVAGGAFEHSGDRTVHRLARLESGDHWAAMIEPGPDGQAPSGHVFTLLNDGGNILAGGSFTRAGNQPAPRIARWDGGQWHPFGDGMNGSVYSIQYFNGDLIAGGIFTQSGSQRNRAIARWDGEQWHPLGDVIRGHHDVEGIEISPLINDMALFGDKLAIAGWFWGRDNNNDYFGQLVLWDGEQWTRAGSSPALRMISAVTEYRGELIAGGSPYSGRVSGAVRWDGETWHNMGESFASVRALQVIGDQLFAAGQFRISENELQYRVARWDDDHWQPLDGVFNGNINVLHERTGQLYAAGDFTEIDGEPASRIARWNGSRWERFDHQIDRQVHALTNVDEDLYLGGSFRIVSSQASHYIARWMNVPTSADRSDSGDGPGTSVQQPIAFRLLSNYPNPFNPATNIVWEQPEQSHIRITVYDITGRRIARILDEARPAGRHEIRFDAGRLSSGLYLYRVDADGHALHGQMMLVK